MIDWAAKKVFSTQTQCSHMKYDIHAKHTDLLSILMGLNYFTYMRNEDGV